MTSSVNEDTLPKFLQEYIISMPNKVLEQLKVYMDKTEKPVIPVEVEMYGTPFYNFVMLREGQKNVTYMATLLSTYKGEGENLEAVYDIESEDLNYDEVIIDVFGSEEEFKKFVIKILDEVEDFVSIYTGDMKKWSLKKLFRMLTFWKR